MLDTEKKLSKKEQALAILDAADKEIPLNPDDLISKKQTDSEFAKMIDSVETQEFKVGDVVKGKITDIRNNFIVVDVNYKSEGLIPKSEFHLSKNEKAIEVGQEVEVYIDKLENENGSIVLSKDKADMQKVWNDIVRAKENNETIQGTVISQVKGGLNVDIGVRAFLPGSQLSLRPIKSLKSFVGQTLDLKVIKVNEKRGNIVVSRKVLLDKDKDSLPPLTDLKEGQIVKGIVKNITDYGAFIDLGECDGLLHITDMSWTRVDHPSSVVKVGETLELKILKYQADKNRISLGLKQLNEEKWNEIIENIEVGAIMQGKVSNLVDYGAFIVLENGVEGLVHVNEISWTKKVKNANHALKLNDEVTVKVIDLQKENFKLSLSIKQATDNPWNKISEKYTVGQEIEVPIVSISDFGLFVKIDDDIDGLVHVSDVSWTESVQLNERYKVNETIKVKVLDINPSEEKFSLGIKQLQENPWSYIEQTYPIGSRHEVTISRIVDFGVFAKLAENVEGLIHISELSTKRIESPSDVVKVGDKVTVEIINIDQDAKKIGLSIRVVESGESSGMVNGEANSGFMENIFAKVLKKSLNADGTESSEDSADTEQDSEDK